MNPITAITVSNNGYYARLWIRVSKPRKTPTVQWPINANYRQPDLMLEAIETYADRFPVRRNSCVWRFMAYNTNPNGNIEQHRIRITRPLLPNDIKRGAQDIQPITFDEAYDLLRCHIHLLLT
jgi:hypothetical protein